MANPRFETQSNEKPVYRDWRAGSAPPFKLAKTDEDIATRDTGTVSVYSGSLGSETDTTDNIEDVFNLTDQQADSGTWVLLLRVNGEWALLPLECPA
jgi:hypothetical protein